MTNFKEIFLELRKQSGLTQRELGEILGLSFQTISKWENGNSLPDILLLPKIASIFKVSVDQLLGVIPVSSGVYGKRNKDSASYRDKILNQFISDRELYWNEDYLEFVVKKLWNFSTPVHVAELACGNGCFAHMILPLLPEGSTYTGYEKSPVMRKAADTLLSSNDNAIVTVFDDTDDVCDKFDVVICQGYLRHLESPVEGIDLMKKMSKPGGLIVCHEENRPFENFGLLLGDMKDDSFEKGLYLEKLWNNEMINEGRDYRVGLRLPLLLDAAGLSNIKCRLNDHVDVILGDENSQRVLSQLKSHYAVTSVDENKLLNFLMERGLNQFESQRYLELFRKRKEYMDMNFRKQKIVHVMGLVLCWGYK